MKNRVLQMRTTHTASPRPYDNENIPSITLENAKNGLHLKELPSHDYPWLPNVSTLKSTAKSTISDLNLVQEQQKKNYIYVFEAYIKAPEDGDYTFYLAASNKAFIKIHHANLIDVDYGYSAGKTI